MKKVRLTTNTAEGNEGDIVDLDDTTADIYIREGMATTDFEEEKRSRRVPQPREKSNRARAKVRYGRKELSYRGTRKTKTAET